MQCAAPCRTLAHEPPQPSLPPYAGESYAGHYVPNLAAAIVDGNRAAAASGPDAAGRINLQGFLVGNPWTDAAIDNLGECGGARGRESGLPLQYTWM
jgi:hypothetical protein